VPARVETVEDLLTELRTVGVGRGDLVAVSLAPGLGVGIAVGGAEYGLAAADPATVIGPLEDELRPRWVWWSNATATALGAAGVRIGFCWDLAAVHRLLFGGWRAEPAEIWASLNGLRSAAIPLTGQLDLLADGGEDGTDPEQPVRPDRHLRPEWISGGWSRGPDRLARWAGTALQACELQHRQLAALTAPGDVTATARSESAAELLCAELSTDGLPMDIERAEQLIASFVGARPVDDAGALTIRRQRDSLVLRHLPGDVTIDLRNPAQVKAMLLRLGIDLPDTRAWRLETFRGIHPVIEELLRWRKAERIATTFGYGWLDDNVGPDGRLRGAWTGSDGAAGRMTAGAGLHNMPADLRPAVSADEGYVFVRADLGQIEPRVLAAVSGDPALARATADDDLYAPVAARLNVERSVAKVAVLAAMYGQTSGAAGEALKGLESAYPVAMFYLKNAYDAGRAGRDVRTYGGRLVRMWSTPEGLDEAAERATVASRGRYARNAVVQGAAAELFKAWAVTVRARATAFDARVVLCLHDELLVHVPAEHGDAVAELLRDCLAEAARRWAPGGAVRFVADVSIIRRWSDAKA
jgi:DNA polymerase I